jgi:hypothetical protein
LPRASDSLRVGQEARQRDRHGHSTGRGSCVRRTRRGYFGSRSTTSVRRGNERLGRRVAAEAAGATLCVCAYIDQQKKENLDWGAFRIKSD